MTYSEQNHAKVFNWNEFLAKETYTNEELKQAHELASGWVTCACGQQEAGIERDQHGNPRDYELSALGTRFYNAIRTMNLWSNSDKSFTEQAKASAITTLKRINSRAAELLNKNI